mmetsp:Transcript_53094/g.154627  ORF Transcript_53094/g.154627 Transcript_53094/m.154627 type:complete len:93 (-) Transcript_53094:456-734(-)
MFRKWDIFIPIQNTRDSPAKAEARFGSGDRLYSRATTRNQKKPKKLWMKMDGYIVGILVFGQLKDNYKLLIERRIFSNCPKENMLPQKKLKM